MKSEDATKNLGEAVKKNVLFLMAVPLWGIGGEDKEKNVGNFFFYLLQLLPFKIKNISV